MTYSKVSLQHTLANNMLALRVIPKVNKNKRKNKNYIKKPIVKSMATIAADDVPDMNKRIIMNWILVGCASLPIAAMAGPYLLFFVPKSAGGTGGAQSAKDALGNDITLESWTKTHLPGDHSLSQGLKGDPTYLIVKEDGDLENFGLNAVCTHLGCVVPWIKVLFRNRNINEIKQFWNFILT